MRKRILIVDDEPSIRTLYQEEFAEEGFEVKVVASGQEALAELDRFQPDVVTLDIKMAGMDGIETLRAIKERRRDVPVILCTAYQEYQDDFGCWACDAYVVKSSDLSELKAAVLRSLRTEAA
ncbi:MAG TPA: response regulator [Thermodesulfobacteriota bacterium]|nr:response regulator [Thermodesulfobacteriota bacterium]